MPRFAANLSMLFTEQPFLDRFAAARKAGFDAVEYLFPYDYPKETLSQLLRRHGLKQVLHNLPAGDWAAGERGIACHPQRVKEFSEGVSRAIEYAHALDCPQVNCLAGKLPQGVNPAEAREVFVENLRFAAGLLRANGIRLLIEPINHFDIPGFFLTRTDQALAIIEEVASDNLFVQYDIYHAQRMEGELAATLRKNLPRIGHIQLADNPGRNEPGTGEINWRFLLRHIDAIGWKGHIGCEYKPKTTTAEGLNWLEEQLQ
ncbi:MAG TPA: hydroxypyruvate isomerase [Ramlibacter sp.]|uniref:hydroxypyruvate isomerase n=1 Tax=Ramlibacter sp. TaxID=1917967 RepID=UPI002B83301F|nr:hydroxypyruvate isomerase [Ramlibacter sp.]HVZ45366.1 hydroxypyruvate isomerase [Ramlibacter sp.]